METQWVPGYRHEAAIFLGRKKYSVKEATVNMKNAHLLSVISPIPSAQTSPRPSHHSQRYKDFFQKSSSTHPALRLYIGPNRSRHPQQTSTLHLPDSHLTLTSQAHKLKRSKAKNNPEQHHIFSHARLPHEVRSFRRHVCRCQRLWS